MVEPLFRFDGQTKIGSVVTLAGPEGHHAASVRRMRVGERIALTDGSSNHARGVVTAVGQKSVEVKILEASAIAKPEIEFVLIQALAKGDRDELAIQAATELGCTRIIPWQAERSVSKWDESKRSKQVARWETITAEAAKQALRPLFPTINQPVTSKQLAQSIVGKTVLVLDPTAEESLGELKVAVTGEVLLIVGPEGGISESELALFEAAGAKRVHLGAGILRTSTAGMAAIAFLAGSNGLWR